MYYGNIKYNDIANGEGVRTSLFVSGCRNYCSAEIIAKAVLIKILGIFVTDRNSQKRQNDRFWSH